MFTNLIASGVGPTTEERGTVPSVLLHVGVIAAMIVATQAGDPYVDVGGPTRIVPLIAPMTSPQPTAPTPAPAAPTAPAPVPEVPTVPIEAPSVPVVPVEAPTGIPVEAPPAPLNSAFVGDPNALPGTETGAPAGSTTGTAAFEAEGVDVPVRLRANSPLPLYPDVLRQSRVSGGVRVRFVVGTDGRVEMGSVVIVEESHPAFAAAVRNVLPRLRFTPARVGPRAVRQFVELPFGFELR